MIRSNNPERAGGQSPLNLYCCKVCCTPPLQQPLQRPSNSLQVVENIGVLHATLHGVAVRCVATPPLGVATLQRNGNDLEHISGIIARLVATRPDVFDPTTRLRIFAAARRPVGVWHNPASDNDKNCKFCEAVL